MFGNMLGDVPGHISELTEQLKTKAGLSDEQAQKVIETIKSYVVEKYPMLQGAMDSMLGGK